MDMSLAKQHDFDTLLAECPSLQMEEALLENALVVHSGRGREVFTWQGDGSGYRFRVTESILMTDVPVEFLPVVSVLCSALDWNERMILVALEGAYLSGGCICYPRGGATVWIKCETQECAIVRRGYGFPA